MTLANALSATRGLLVIPVIALIATGDASYALVVFLGAAATDALDGPIARRRGATAFGAALDPLADKILVVGTLAALVVRGIAPAWAVALIFARELIAIEVRARAPHAVGASVDGNCEPCQGRVFKDGETATFQGKEVRIKTGNAAVVQVNHNGQVTASLGRPGEVVERVFVAQ